MTPTEYEEVVRNLAETLHSSIGAAKIVRLTSGKNSHVEGVSGQHHQIDVVLQDDLTVFLIECKCWNGSVDLPPFLTHLGRLTDITGMFPTKNVIGVVVTTKGFDPGPERVASSHGIELWHVKSANDFILRYRNYCQIGVSVGMRIAPPVVTVMKHDEAGNLLETAFSDAVATTSTRTNKNV